MEITKRENEPSNAWQGLRRLWDHLIEPARRAEGVNRRQHRLLVAILLGVCICVMLFVPPILLAVQSGTFPKMIFIVVLATLVLFIADYVLARTGYYYPGVFCLLFGFTFSPYLLMILDRTPTQINHPLIGVSALGIVIASILLSRRELILTTLILGAGVLLVPVFNSAVDMTSTVYPLGVVALTAILIALSDHHRTQLEKERQTVLTDALQAKAASLQMEREMEERKRAEAERERLQQQVIEAQKQALAELSTPIIPIMEGIIVMPLVGGIDTARSRDIMRALLEGVSEHKAQIAILDITGVPVVDSGVADHLNRTSQAARLKGAQTIVTGISSAVAEAIVDLGIDWHEIETQHSLQTGLLTALARTGFQLMQRSAVPTHGHSNGHAKKPEQAEP